MYKVTFKTDSPVGKVREALSSLSSFDVDIHRLSRRPAVKGGNFERNFCKNLSLWVSEGRYQDVFWRTRGSGGWSTRMKSPTQVGDVILTPERAVEFQWCMPLIIELRNRELEFHRVIPTLTRWYLQLIVKIQGVGLDLDKCFPMVVLNAKNTWVSLADFSITGFFPDFDEFWVNERMQLVFFPFRKFTQEVDVSRFKEFLDWRSRS